MTKDKTAQELALEDLQAVDGMQGHHIAMVVQKHWETIKQALTPPSDDAVRDALQDLKHLRSYARSLDDNIPIHHFERIDRLTNRIEQALQSRAGQEGDVDWDALYKIRNSLPTGKVFNALNNWMYQNDHRKTGDNIEPQPHPSRADAVDVDTVTAKCLEQNFSFNKAQGEFEYFTKLIINFLVDQGYLTQKPDDGMVLVPIEPTDAMLDIMHNTVRIDVIPKKKEANILNDVEVYKAMIAQHLTED